MLFSLLVVLAFAQTQGDAIPGVEIRRSELPSPTPREVQTRVEEVNRRYTRAKRMTKFPIIRDETSMVNAKQLQYELNLFAVARGPFAATDAAAFVQELKPCYEWEGYADCPRREAQFIERAMTERHIALRSLGHVLPLWSAHLWMCAAELSTPSASAEEARAKADKMFALAAQSDDPLVRAAADALKRRGKCHP